MYMQHDISAAAAPLFHIDPPRIDPVQRRAEIDRVIEIATAAILRAQMRKLGGLSFAPARDDDDHSYFGQIRSEPVGNTGLKFRFPMSARGTGDRDLEHVAAELVEGADCIARATRTLKKLSPVFHDAADKAIEAGKGGIAEMRIVAIGLTPGRAAEQLKVTVDVEMLGDDLRAGIERVSEHTRGGRLERLEERLRDLAAKHVERRKVLARAKVAGATGFIDDSALRVLDISGLGRAAALGSVAIYARYSSDRQSERSIEDQVRLCRERADREGWPVVKVFPDFALSGATRDRPGLNALLARAGEFDVILAEALDRISRDQEDVAAIWKRVEFAGCRLFTVSEGAIGELQIGFTVTMSAMFLKNLADKTRRGQVGRVAAGRIPGGLCYGYAADAQIAADGSVDRGRRRIVPEQAEVVRRIFAWHAEGRSASFIVRQLNGEGIPGPTGGPWRISTICGSRQRRNGILNNELYAGRIVFNRQRFMRDPATRKRISRPNPESE